MSVSSRDNVLQINMTNTTSDRVAVRPGQRLRIGFWGTHSLFSQVVLTTLLDHDTVTHGTMTMVALPAGKVQASPVALWPPPPMPAMDELVIVNNLFVNNGGDSSVVQTAWQQLIPTYQVQQLRSPTVAQWLAAMALDLVCVACFPWRIPATLLTLPTFGFLNVHPSLLPAYRGPAPLFWQLRAGASSGGVTVHWMDATFDTGPIAVQSAIPFPDGATSADLDRLHAITGAGLLLDLIGQLEAGCCPQQSQAAGGTQQSWPTTADFRLDPQWSARHAYQFMRGTDEWRQPYPITVEREELWLRQALSYLPDQQLGQPMIRSGAQVAIQFAPGVLQALLW